VTVASWDKAAAGETALFDSFMIIPPPVIDINDCVGYWVKVKRSM
jgi:hypothetical protein